MIGEIFENYQPFKNIDLYVNDCDDGTEKNKDGSIKLFFQRFGTKKILESQIAVIRNEIL